VHRRAPDANEPASGSFKDQWYGGWSPSASPDDPHDAPYKEGKMGTIGAGPVAANIKDGNPLGRSPTPHLVTAPC
jgi:hypothetical protein